jgi:hypothetical protein
MGFSDRTAKWRCATKYFRQTVITDPDPRAKRAKWRVIDREWDRCGKIWLYTLVPA